MISTKISERNDVQIAVETSRSENVERYLFRHVFSLDIPRPLISPMTVCSALLQDSEVTNFLASVFKDEFHWGAASVSPISVRLTTPNSPQRRHCQVEECNNFMVSKGFCIRHGGGLRCRVDGCKTSAKRNGLCWKHGGSLACKREGCTNLNKSRGFCWSHGGGKPCSKTGCDRTALRGGRCWAHGGGKRCTFDGCNRPCVERHNNLCPQHFRMESLRQSE
ncbi:hypothetical protein Ae201684_018916 [Aphanomyces euteiches]|uniref:WRKY19-like zinc finger domain-containing protein n=1 Tax=Aphanomyces euteiches TaxID=100861 RepID=A0A6G0W487_9STRA|nr:hypothetical protein Ae201684_018916 [Aphanomyces euteiches]